MNIKELKEIIKNLPDDMQVLGSCGDQLYCPGHFILSEDTLTDEEIKDGYPLGVTPTFVITVD